MNKASQLLIAMGALLFISAAIATTCPTPGSIVSGEPNPEGTMATYLSPGWSSDLTPTIDLADTTFAMVYADASEMKCIYDTNQGFLTLYPNNNAIINTSQLINTPHWHCQEQQGAYNDYNLQIVCTCDNSLKVCSFTLQGG